MLKQTDPVRTDAGFTLVELVIVLLLASVVLIAALSALTSLANAAGNNDSVVRREQAVSSVLAQLERDVRSSASISTPAGASAADELQLAVPDATGTTEVLWVHDSSAGTLTRETEVDGAFQPGGLAVEDVSNDPATPVFTYYRSDASLIPTTTASTVDLCATAVGIDVRVKSSQAGGGGFGETSEVALTDQAQSLTAPGDGQCGS